MKKGKHVQEVVVGVTEIYKKIATLNEVVRKGAKVWFLVSHTSSSSSVSIFERSDIAIVVHCIGGSNVATCALYWIKPRFIQIKSWKQEAQLLSWCCLLAVGRGQVFTAGQTNYVGHLYLVDWTQD